MIDPKLLPTVLKALLAHGDADHQRWLCEAIDAVFDGRHPPAPYGKANWEVERDSLRAERDLLRKSIERMISAAGNPNAIRGCQVIVKIGKEALARRKDE